MTPTSTLKTLLLLCFLLLFKNAFAQLPVCGTNDSLTNKYLANYAQRKDLTRARTSAGEKLEYRLAIDINYATYQLYNKDKERLTKEAHRFIQAASDVFEREINVKLTITYIHIWEEPEPYQLVGDFDYFINVLNYWNLNRFEERDAIVAFSCRNGWFYGGYRMCTSNFPFPDNSYVDVDLLSHELGHTLGSPHTHSCFWPGGPIDRCTDVEGPTPECEGGYSEGINGSIMSYCRSVLSFHPLCRNLMRDYAEGKIQPEFKLGALTEIPSPALPMALKFSEANNARTTPAFEWPAAFRADRYRFQIASDNAFTQIVEDTLVNQAYFQSRGQDGGNYFARYRAENQAANTAWSDTFPFSIAGFSDNAMPPLILLPKITGPGELSGQFYAFAGTTNYEVEVTELNESRTSISALFDVANSPGQRFVFPSQLDWFKQYAVRLRVKKNNLWSRWSEAVNLPSHWFGELWKQIPRSKMSAEPVLANVVVPNTQRPGAVTGYLQVATDSDFRNIVFQDSAKTNAMQEWYTNKAIFTPKLNENTEYHIRSRSGWGTGKFTGWSAAKINTGFRDERFEYLGLVSSNLQQISYANMTYPKSRFHKTADKLYVHDMNAGYYATTDLKTWEPIISSTTNGQMPNAASFFGVDSNGDLYAIDQSNKLTRKSGQTYTTTYSPESYYTDQFGPILITRDQDLFFRTGDKGIARIHNGDWQFYPPNTFQTNRLTALAIDSQDNIWTVTAAGNVWKFSNGQWQEHSYMQGVHGTEGIAFDNAQNAYAYGEFGVMKYNSGNQSWESIAALAQYPVKKILFDKDNTMWLSAFQLTDFIIDFQALIKYKEGKISVYSDGLNIFKEAFDIELFKDQLLILTSGGELHRFTENKIQRFEAKSDYCTGNELNITITSNSTFSKDNTFSVLLRNESTSDTLIIPAPADHNQIKISLPDSLAAGDYSIRTITSNPAIVSNTSDRFRVHSVPRPEIIAEQTGSTTVLKLKTSSNSDFQWQRDGVSIPGATNASINATEPGAYSLLVSNAGGCESKSNVLTIDQEMPSEVQLLQNKPNPIAGDGEIAFYLPDTQEINLELFNSKGQMIAQLAKGSFQAGWHLAKLNAARIPNGVYIYRLKAGNVTKSLKMVR